MSHIYEFVFFYVLMLSDFWMYLELQLRLNFNKTDVDISLDLSYWKQIDIYW